MNYRVLGKTGLKVSEIGFGAEWMPGDDAQAVREVTRAAAAAGVNIVDCWMADPAVRADGDKPMSRGLPPATFWKRGLHELLSAFRSPGAPANRS